MKTSEFDYHLPDRLIARYPLDKRDQSKLLVYDRDRDEVVHKRFDSVLGHVSSGDAVVINDTRVFKARLFGKKSGTDGEVEFLCLHPVEGHSWKVICRPARRLRVGTEIEFGLVGVATVREELERGERIVEFSDDPLKICEVAGELPIPPYLNRKAEDIDLVRYQTVYGVMPGSVAAPTAGLHFTEEMISELEARDVDVIPLTLHVGWGTFKPISTDVAEDHRVEEEWFSVTEATSERVIAAKARGGKLFCVGTTTTRALESWWQLSDGKLGQHSGFTELFIHPPFRFNLVDKLITNFHHHKP